MEHKTWNIKHVMRDANLNSRVLIRFQVSGFRFQVLREGFTIVEMAVVMLIITSISAIVLISFTGLHEASAINRGAREVGLAVRRAQNMSFAVTQINTLIGPKIPPAVGVRLQVGSPSYFLFADMVQDNKYSETAQNGLVDTKVSSTETVFDGGIAVASLTSYSPLGTPQQNDIVHVMFLAPEAVVVLSDVNGSSLGDTLEIGLASASGAAKKTVVVRTSGQVSIK